MLKTEIVDIGPPSVVLYNNLVNSSNNNKTQCLMCSKILCFVVLTFKLDACLSLQATHWAVAMHVLNLKSPFMN